MTSEKTIPFKTEPSRSYPWGVITGLVTKPNVTGLVVPNLRAHAFWFRTRRAAKQWARSNLALRPLTWGIIGIEHFAAPDARPSPQYGEVDPEFRPVFPDAEGQH